VAGEEICRIETNWRGKLENATYFILLQIYEVNSFTARRNLDSHISAEMKMLACIATRCCWIFLKLSRSL